jgi:predicted Zn-dependent peptidase
MYRDVPEDFVGQLSSEAMWGDHPLGREIAGEPETVAALTPAALRDHHQHCYRPDAAVLTVAGAIDADELHEAAVACLGDWKGDGPLPVFLPAPPLQAAPRHRLQIRDSEQAHLQLAVPGLPRDHPDRFSLGLLNALAGDGMSSRLWQRLREQRGLAYNIGSYVSMFADSGSLGVYGGCDAARLFETLDETASVWRELQTRPAPQTELQHFKEYMKGRLELSSEDSSSVASWWGRQLATGSPMQTLDQVLNAIDAVTAADVQRLAQELWQPQHLTLAYVGPLADETSLTHWLTPPPAAH